MTMNRFSGVITALVTPFKNGEIDKGSFVRLLHQQIQQGVSGFVVNGTTGESPTLKIEEVRTLFEIAKTETLGTQIQLIVGTGSNSTAATCEMSRQASTWNPDAVLVVVPYYNRPPQRGLEQHFVAVAKASSVPVLLYNVPSRTVNSLEPETVIRLSRAENIFGIKDATGDMATLAKIRSGVDSTFALLSGDDGSCVEYCARGGHGVISVSSHVIGREMVEAIGRARHGEIATDMEYRKTYQDLMKWLYVESNPIPVKMALHWMGVLDSPELRLPLTALDEKYQGEFKACLKSLGKI